MSEELKELVTQLDKLEDDVLGLVNGPLARNSTFGDKVAEGNIRASEVLGSAVTRIRALTDFFHGELRRNERAAKLAEPVEPVEAYDHMVPGGETLSTVIARDHIARLKRPPEDVPSYPRPGYQDMPEVHVLYDQA